MRTTTTMQISNSAPPTNFMNDHIHEMTEKELCNACKEVLGKPYIVEFTHLFGHVMSMLCEWQVSFERIAKTKVYRLYKDDINFFGTCVLSAFLRVAVALGKWSPPKEEAYYMDEEGYVSRLTKGQTAHESWKRVSVTDWKE